MLNSCDKFRLSCLELVLQLYLFAEAEYLTVKLKREEEGAVCAFAFVLYKLNSQMKKKRVYGFAMDLPPNH